MDELKDKNIIIATHVYATGPAHDLKDFLLKYKVKSLLFISHPLFFDKKLKGSGYERFEKGKRKYEKYQKIRNIPSILSYFKDVFLTLLWGLNQKEKIDIFFGSNNLNAFSGIILQKLGRVRRVIYYCIDYNPKRFQNSLLNTIYHWLDRFCVKHADETWNLSPRMEEARKEYFRFESKKQKVVPLGVWFKRFKRKKFEEINKNRLVFMGHVLKKQGIQYVIDAIPLIQKEIPDFSFLIIGGGEYLETLKKKVQKMKLKNVDFTGYIEKHEDVENLLSDCTAAVAFYEKYDEFGNLSFTYFADPGKIKLYLASGLPIFLTDVPHNAREIVSEKCGFIVSQKKENIASAVISLFKDEKILKEYRKNTIFYGEKFDWEKIFEKALNEL